MSQGGVDIAGARFSSNERQTIHTKIYFRYFFINYNKFCRKTTDVFVHASIVDT